MITDRKKFPLYVFTFLATLIELTGSMVDEGKIHDTVIVTTKTMPYDDEGIKTIINGMTLRGVSCILKGYQVGKDDKQNDEYSYMFNLVLSQNFPF